MNCNNAKLVLTVEKIVAKESYYAFRFCGHTLKGKNFWTKPQKENLSENTFEVNVWLSYIQSNQYRSIGLFFFNTCDNKQKEKELGQNFISSDDNLASEKSRQVEKRCFVGATKCLRNIITGKISPSNESCSFWTSTHSKEVYLIRT